MSENRFNALSTPPPETRKTPKDFRSNKSRRPKKDKSKVHIPSAVVQQGEYRKKYHYAYRVVANGNVENNSTLYVTTGVAHPHQVENLFIDVIRRAKNMPQIFGKDFECDFQVNVVRRYSGEYMGYAFVDVTNPKFYYAMIGCNVDGSDRAVYIDDPKWVPPKLLPKVTRENHKIVDWAAECEDDDLPPAPPKIRRELEPLIKLGEYEYDEQQRQHLKTDATHGTVSVSPAFITPGVKEDKDDCSLYVSEVPAIDYDFLYAIFARYARYPAARETDTYFYPKINIRKCNQDKNENKTGIFAIIQYSHPYDAAFALAMLQKVRAKYKGIDVSMPVRYAYRYRNI